MDIKHSPLCWTMCRLRKRWISMSRSPASYSANPPSGSTEVWAMRWRRTFRDSAESTHHLPASRAAHYVSPKLAVSLNSITISSKDATRPPLRTVQAFQMRPHPHQCEVRGETEGTYSAAEREAKIPSGQTSGITPPEKPTKNQRQIWK